LERQIRLFSHASVVVGEFGSGMHNTVFSPRDTKIGVLGFNNLVQSFIAALRSQRIAYLRVDYDSDGKNYSINVDSFRRFVGGVLGAI
jgi:capsular polysaccharide biosynthesis protein